MAAQNRATNAALIDANLPDNTTQLITPEKHREVEDALNDSAFNVLDDDAFDVPYTPTTPSSWGATVPSETGGALDILIEKLNNKASNNIAYVASTGSDTIGEFEEGNPLRPFLTLPVAIAAMPPSNFIIKVLGNSYSLGATLTITSKSKFLLDLSSVTITGDISTNNCFDSFIDLRGGNIIGSLNLSGGGSQRIGLVGGEISNTTTSLTLGESSFISSCRVSSSAGVAVTSAATDQTNRAFVSNCRISAPASAAVFSAFASVFDTCYIEGNRALEGSNTALNSVFSNCIMTGSGNQAIQGNNGLNVTFKNCKIRATSATGNAFNLGGNCNGLRIYDCEAIAGQHIFNFAINFNRFGDDTEIRNCSFFPKQGGVSGLILNDFGAYGVDTGIFRFIRNTYSEAWSTVDPARAIDYNSTTIVGLLPPPL